MPMAAVQTMHSVGLVQSASMMTDLRNLQTNLNRRLAPAPIDKKKISYSHSYQPTPHQPASVQRRNARERNRVKQVNNGFAALRQHIPSTIAAALGGGRGAARKLSKVDTLRMAVEYIRSLQRLLDEADGVTSSSTGADTPPHSDASRSPAPSLLSDSSSANCAPDHYDVYEPMSPEDEELLDVISWWQQQ